MQKPALFSDGGSVSSAMKNPNNDQFAGANLIVNGIGMLKRHAYATAERLTSGSPISGDCRSTSIVLARRSRNRVAIVSSASVAMYAQISARSASAVSVRRRVRVWLITFSRVQ